MRFKKISIGLITAILILTLFLIQPGKVNAQTCAGASGFCGPIYDCLHGSLGQLDCPSGEFCCRRVPGQGVQTGIFGWISLPDFFKYGLLTTPGKGPVLFLNNIVKLLIIIGGLFAFFNIILAGYSFLSAGDDPKKMEGAWRKIWQSLLGLLFIAGAFVLAAIFGWLLFGDVTAILKPKIYGP